MAMKSPAEGIKTLLINAGLVGGATGWAISTGKLPTSPDTAVAVVTTGGLSPMPKLLLNQPSVQVMIRGKVNGYTAAETKAYAIQDALLGIASQSVNGDFWGGITEIGDVGSIGFDEKDRPLFVANFSIIIEPASGTNRQAIL